MLFYCHALELLRNVTTGGVKVGLTVTADTSQARRQEWISVKIWEFPQLQHRTTKQPNLTEFDRFFIYKRFVFVYSSTPTSKATKSFWFDSSAEIKDESDTWLKMALKTEPPRGNVFRRMSAEDEEMFAKPSSNPSARSEVSVSYTACHCNWVRWSPFVKR